MWMAVSTWQCIITFGYLLQLRRMCRLERNGGVLGLGEAQNVSHFTVATQDGTPLRLSYSSR